MAIMQSRGRNLTPPLRIQQFRGINLSVTPTQIDDNQSPDMLNMNIDERGALNKRTGFEKVFASLGPGKINGIYQFEKIDGTTFNLVAHTTKLYTFLLDGTPPTEIYTGLADSKLNFFTMNDKCYIMDGTNFLVYDGTTVSSVTPYIPTFTVADTGLAEGYTIYEDINLIGDKFKETRTGNGTTTVFYTGLKNLNSITNVKVDGVATSPTVDLVNGKITFSSAPATGTNNVEWIASKTITGNAEKIKQCKIFSIFGGTQDTRVFLAKDNYVYRSGLYDPTYWPENGFYKFNDIVKGFSRQYDYLVAHLDNGYRVINYNLVDGVASFPSKPINDQIGTIATHSIQIIENNPVSLSKDGVYMLVASSLRDERNVQHISENVDAKLLNEPNLTEAISIDYDRKYWLAVNGNVYIFDYALGEWYIYDNIYATQFIEIDSYLYFGGLEGVVYRFKKETDTKPYNDDGSPIKAYWKSKQLYFGVDERMKLVEKVFYSLKPNTRSSVDLYYISNKKKSDLIKTSRMDSFDFSDIDFNLFTFATSDFPQEVMNKIKAKKVTHFQLVFENNQLDESMGIPSIVIKFSYQGMVK